MKSFKEFILLVLIGFVLVLASPFLVIAVLKDILYERHNLD
jgi:hypothetical protein